MKRTFQLIGALLIVFLFLFNKNTSITKAQIDCQCSHWTNTGSNCGTVDHPSGCVNLAQCDTGSCSSGGVQGAPPGQYLCNSGSGLCDIGEPPANGGNEGGGNEAGQPNTDCTLSIDPSPITMYSLVPPQNTSSLTANVSVTQGSIDVVGFTVADTGIATVLPDADFAPAPYTTTITGLSYGITSVTATATRNGVSECWNTATVIVGEPRAWWQVKDSDVQTNSNLGSYVPFGNYFGLPGGGGWPGVPTYGGSSSFYAGAVSQVGWTANTISTSQRVYNHAYFAGQIPESIQTLTKPVTSQADLSGATPDESGYEWYKFTGTGLLNMNIDSALNIGARKVILIVDGADTNIDANISLTTGFFLLITEQDIVINPSVIGLEGLYVADGTVSTGTLGPDVNGNGQDSSLSVRGSVAAYGGINLQRELPDNSLPAEFFEYAPDQILLFPSTLGVRRINWKEVAP